MKTRQIKILVLTIIILLGIQVSFNPISLTNIKIQNTQNQRQLIIAREKWQSHEINNYLLDIEVFTPSCLYDSKITIKDGALVEVKTRQNLFTENSSFESIPPENWGSSFGIISCDYNEFSVTSIFEKAERLLQNSGKDKVTIGFDETYGYITELIYRCNVARGFFDPKITDCGFGFHFSNLTILTSVK